jgi:phosphomannomutase
MKINPSVFKAYDIRGIYSEDFDEETAYKIGRAFVIFLSRKDKKLNIVVGRDNRLSSPKVSKSLIKGILTEGANVIDIGLATTPMFYFAVAHFNFDAGIVVTASHNPKEYNGFKLVREKAVPISGETGINKIKEIVLNLEKEKEGISKGKIIKKEILKDYANFVLKDLNKEKIKPLKIVIDTANSISGILIPEIFKKTSFKIFHIFSKLDGSFPNHPADPLKKENLTDLQEEIKKQRADLGVAFDGDGDRIIFVAENGEIIPAYLILSIVSEIILKDKKGEKVLYDLRAGNIAKETIERSGGVALMSRVGHSFIKERMRKEDILLTGELSGHYYFRGNYFFESPFFILFKIIEKISESGRPLSELIKKYKKYFHSGEINFKVEDKDKKIKELENYFKEGEISHLDGIRIDFPDWWFNVRPSNTEPLLRLVVEAKTEKLMEEKKEEIEKLILN